jgi:hypothetical protein
MAIECTLVCDGSSDVALIHILKWLFSQLGVLPSPQVHWYDPRGCRSIPSSMAERIDHAVDLYPCDLLFIHRDEEGQGLTSRTDEIRYALAASNTGRAGLPVVFVIPVRMMEAWLLFNEGCIRQAAGCPRGRSPLSLPHPRDCEDLPDPKTLLRSALRIATEKQGRRLKKFNADVAVHRLAELIEDFSPLRQLTAFQNLEAQLRTVVTERGWA